MMIFTVTPNPAIDHELTVSSLEWNTVSMVTETRTDCGGKGFNVSRALAKLGQPSTALAFIGQQAEPWMAACLTKEGITPQFTRISGETRTNTTIVSQQGGRHVKANQPGPSVSSAEAGRMLESIRALASPASWWALCGSLPPGLPPSLYGDAIRLLKEAGAFTLLDSSGEALLQGQTAGPTIIKPNAFEASQLTGKPIRTAEDAIQTSQALLTGGTDHALITLGSQGAIYACSGQCFHAIPPPIREANPVGAGDALAAGLLDAISRQFDPAETLAWAVACGTAAAALPGTTMPGVHQIREILPQVKVSSL